jgi:trehalose/maltose transport system permease protein
MSQQAAQVPTAQVATRRGTPAFDVPTTSWAKARERLAWMLVAPSLLVVTLVAIFPLVQSFWFSLTNARLAGTPRGGLQFVGLENYAYLLGNDDFLRAARNTVVFTVGSVSIETVLGVVVALIINSQFRGKGLLRTAILVPWAIPTVVSSRLWQYMFNANYGVLNDLLVYRLPNLFDWIPVIGPRIASIFPERPIAFLATPGLQMPTAIAVDVWKTTPFMALLILAGLQVIPGDVYEAAYVDGANKWQQFWQHTLPLLRPALLVALIFRTLDAFRVFDVLWVMFGPITQTRSLAIAAQQALVDGDRLGRASAASALIFLCIAALVLVYTRLVKVEEG